jgi:SAM-dependent methyltransferase
MTTKTDFVRGTESYLPIEAQRALFHLPRRCEFLVKHAGRSPKRVLDVGCATGYISRLLMELGHEVTGIELNSRMAFEARAQGVEVLEHDLEQPLPLPDASVEVVHACEIIEHLFDTEGFLQELNRVLVTGGVLILSTPNLNSLANRFRVFFGLPLPMWGAYPLDRHGSHVRIFNKAKIMELLVRTGFRTEVVMGINHRFSRAFRFLDHFATWSELILIKAIRQ